MLPHTTAKCGRAGHLRTLIGVTTGIGIHLPALAQRKAYFNSLKVHRDTGWRPNSAAVGAFDATDGNWEQMYGWDNNAGKCGRGQRKLAVNCPIGRAMAVARSLAYWAGTP